MTKVESAARPDGLRLGSPSLFERLNRDKAVVDLPLETAWGRAELARLVADADVVIEASRPRALAQLGIDVDALMASAAGPQVWISITGFGRAEPDRVAFGDVAAAAGGLLAWEHGVVDGVDQPTFLGDAIADPLAGLVAALAAFEALASGRRGVIDVSMADVAAWFTDPASMPPARQPSRRRQPVTGLLLRDVEVEGRRTSVVIEDGVIVSVGDDPDRSRLAVVIDGRGGALIPGLHDHHIHLAASAAIDRSVDVGPATVSDAAGLSRTLASAAAHAASADSGWIRAVGYHHSVAGDLDRLSLDRLGPDRSLRVQDATGARWTVNSAGARVLGLDEADVIDDPTLAGIERDASGHATGRLHRIDAWLRTRWQEDVPLSFADLGRRFGRLRRHRRHRHHAVHFG